MSAVSYQTIKISRGRHTRPDDGVCVMELASMLAGERFTDHPASVCPVIGSFLRAYNDLVDHGRRQGLYELASLVVGSRASATGNARASRSSDSVGSAEAEEPLEQAVFARPLADHRA